MELTEGESGQGRMDDPPDQTPGGLPSSRQFSLDLPISVVIVASGSGWQRMPTFYFVPLCDDRHSDN